MHSAGLRVLRFDGREGGSDAIARIGMLVVTESCGSMQCVECGRRETTGVTEQVPARTHTDGTPDAQDLPATDRLASLRMDMGARQDSEDLVAGLLGGGAPALRFDHEALLCVPGERRAHVGLFSSEGLGPRVSPCADADRRGFTNAGSHALDSRLPALSLSLCVTCLL